ncbi:hypothetical protein V8G54_032015 [Vigna mungo]|uniref:Uncharacterized protein n=1 Tax=Vigna mungo TaxID=3915 RepID=A0AAQ3MKP8_VIGMU
MNFTLLTNSVINFTKHCTSLHPSGLGVYINFNCSEIEHVKDEERDLSHVGHALVVMASTSDFHLQVVLLSANDGCLYMRYMQCSYYKKWLSGCGGVETKVSDISIQDGGE